MVDTSGEPHNRITTSTSSASTASPRCRMAPKDSSDALGADKSPAKQIEATFAVTARMELFWENQQVLDTHPFINTNSPISLTNFFPKLLGSSGHKVFPAQRFWSAQHTFFVRNFRPFLRAFLAQSFGQGKPRRPKAAETGAALVVTVPQQISGEHLGQKSHHFSGVRVDSQRFSSWMLVLVKNLCASESCTTHHEDVFPLITSPKSQKKNKTFYKDLQSTPISVAGSVFSKSLGCCERPHTPDGPRRLHVSGLHPAQSQSGRHRPRHRGPRAWAVGPESNGPRTLRTEANSGGHLEQDPRSCRPWNLEINQLSCKVLYPKLVRCLWVERVIYTPEKKDWI